MFFIFLPPSPHVRFRVRVDNRPNIMGDVLFLSALIMQGHLARGKRLKEISYVEFRAASDTYTNIWKVEVGKFFQEPKYPISGRWNLGGVGTLIKGVHY
jgi:hypothetical protein